MDKRIRELRKALGFTQQEFSERIGIKRNTVAQYEMGRNPPTDTVITLICREFNVNEAWLRTGEGEMFVQLSPSEELSAFFGDLLADEPDFRFRLISALSRLDPAEWETLEKIAYQLVDELKKADPE